jgi:hypothetical protein
MATLGMVSVLECGSEAVSCCEVTIKDLNGTGHTLEVTVSSLYEAVAFGITAGCLRTALLQSAGGGACGELNRVFRALALTVLR